MISSTLFTCLILLSLGVSNVAARGTLRKRAGYPGWSNITDMFVFGDSYSRTGFDPTSTQPSSKNPLGNPSSPGTSTSANGPNWVEYLTIKYSESELLTYNFATGGATIDSSIVESKFDLQDEYNQYYIPVYTKNTDAAVWEDQTTLFVLWVGINDVNRSYMKEDPDMNPLIIKNYRKLVDKLYETGARNILFLTIPPIEKTPAVRNDDTPNRVELEEAAVLDYNKRLLAMIEDVESSYSDVAVFHYDAHALFNTVIEDPSQFEHTKLYKDVTTVCAAYEDGTPKPDTQYDGCDYAANEYLWSNTFHPTSPIHKQIAEEVAALLDS